MLFIIVILQAVTIVLMFIFSSWKKTLLPVFQTVCFMILLSGLYVYFLKTGGFSLSQKKFLLGGSFSFSHFTTLAISFNKLASFIITGRMFFVLFFLLHAINHNLHTKNIFGEKPYLYLIPIIPIVTLYYIVQPGVFTRLFAYKYAMQNIISRSTEALLLLYLILALMLLAYEYFDIQLSYIRKQHRNLLVAQLLIALQYTFFALFEPITIYQNYASIRVSTNFIITRGNQTNTIWTIILSLCMLSTIITIFQTWKYYKIDYDRIKKELIINEKIDNASVSSYILMHGLKNQLLSSEILLNKLAKDISALPKGSARDDLASTSHQLINSNDFIKDRISVLYKSFITVHTKLSPESSLEVEALLKKKVQEKLLDTSYITYSFEECSILCDKDLMSETLYNLVVNAAEAVSMREHPAIKVTLKQLRAKTLITVEDNGEGIPKAIRGSIFQPFTTTKNSLTNWGVGLCYSNIIIKKHMGEIRFDTHNGQGTVFLITLPKYSKGRSSEKD